MARSSYIYVVTDPDEDNGLVAAFTVKHELMSWLERQKAFYWEIYRLHDGGPGAYGEKFIGTGTTLRMRLEEPNA